MATTHGNDGTVKIGSNAILEIISFTLDHSADLVEDSAMGDSDAGFKAGLKRWSATIECQWDAADTNGQELFDVGDAMTPIFLPEGPAMGDVSYTGASIVERVNRVTSKDGVVTASFEVRGNAALVQGTVA